MDGGRYFFYYFRRCPFHSSCVCFVSFLFPSCGCYCRCCCCLGRYARAGARPRRENNSVPRIFVSLFLSQGTRNKKYNTVTSERGEAVARAVKACLQEVFGAWTLVLTVLHRSLPIGSMSIVVHVVVGFDLRRGSRRSVYFLGAVRTCGSFFFVVYEEMRTCACVRVRSCARCARIFFAPTHQYYCTAVLSCHLPCMHAFCFIAVLTAPNTATTTKLYRQ